MNVIDKIKLENGETRNISIPADLTDEQKATIRQNIDAVEKNGTYDGMTVGNATNAQNDGTGVNIAEQFADIEELIPPSTTSENQLADKAFVNSSINAMAAFYITSNVAGDAFATKESLTNATTFYQGGQTRMPTQNDYAIVLADESQPKSVDGNYPTTRYSYQGGTYPNGQWDFQYVVNNTSLTQAQVDAINSGITAQKVNATVTTDTTQIISGTKTFTSASTQMYGLRLKNDGNYGAKLNFGDSDYVYLEEPTDDTLKLHGKMINFDGLGTGGLQINGSSGTAGQVLTSNGTSAPAWKTISGTVTGVKGNAESTYRTGNVNLTPANIGAVNKAGDTISGDLSVDGNLDLGGTLNVNSAIEIYGRSASTPFIDFHFKTSNTDYTSRIIESSPGTINVDATLMECGQRVYSNNNPILLNFYNFASSGVSASGSGFFILKRPNENILVCYGAFASTSSSISFPKSFAAPPFVMTSANPNADMQLQRVSVNTVTSTYFTTYNQGDYQGRYIAIGYTYSNS